jgi:hypothetical protein
MTEADYKSGLRRYLQDGRDAMLWKLDGASEYDIRRPLVPSGTNLLGLVKHLTVVELEMFGRVFGRPWDGPMPFDEADPQSDMFAVPGESREYLAGLYRQAWAHTDATVEALPLDATGHVPWWPAGRNEVTLHHALVRMATETARHAGHADIVRELIDGSLGLTPGRPNVPAAGEYDWKPHFDRVEHAARAASS